VSGGGSQHKRRTASSGGRTGDVVSSSAAAAELIYDRVMDCLLRLLYVYVCVCVAATAAAAAGCIIVGSVIRLVVGGVGVRTRGRKGGRGLRRHRIVNSRTAVVGRRRYESVTRSFISHPTSWSFPKRRNDKRERKTQGDSLIHSRPIKENKRGAHFFFFKKGKKRKKPL
jgi:hypothetical protein